MGPGIKFTGAGTGEGNGKRMLLLPGEAIKPRLCISSAMSSSGVTNSLNTVTGDVGE